MVGNQTIDARFGLLLESEWYLLITSKPADQCARKALFTCVVYTKYMIIPMLVWTWMCKNSMKQIRTTIF